MIENSVSKMSNNYLTTKADECIEKIRSVDFQNLGISAYNLQYVQMLLPITEYYFSMCIRAFSLLAKNNPANTTIVDFGGGHGFLSIFLKSLGFKVIYCDLNPLSAETVLKLKQECNLGPDYIIQGSTPELVSFCRAESIVPDCLISIDVIEHVYDLSLLFKNLQLLNPLLEMVFTTASNPKNKIKSHQLRKGMCIVESEYLQKRIKYISDSFPDLTAEQTLMLAKQCRGKNYADTYTAVADYIKSGVIPAELHDRFNTCNPETGNWYERILPLSNYQNITGQYGFHVSFSSGLYNAKRNNIITSTIAKAVNGYINRYQKSGMKAAPYICLHVNSTVKEK
ncbi:MAG: class I SAM-dependent methyltransferase [Bacteroidales bacterium]|jgi:2-polyprenyl-3-methyl-5-hydroxy-6-metoxy-1,4-benzoquinol methylase|nr:class I SAM-dependent methyltransferase [Bacteroidales bacterium]